jgi:hydroxymethylpyrimidine pyrophosphatase-like HAD family hydrolase
MQQFPIDILGNYGMQYAKYNAEIKDIEIIEDYQIACDRESCEKRVTYLREKYGYTKFSGDNVEYHSSGCITFPLLGTNAKNQDKLAFDPDRSKRRAIYNDVVSVFNDYNVFVGGSSSFDMAPRPYNKYYALDKYCKENGFSHNEVVYVGDDYGLGGNDESVYLSDINFIKVDNYLDFNDTMKPFL